jgi:CHASE3 domain sensor protein
VKIAVLVGLVALVAVACGSDKSSQSSSTTDWANGVCSAVTTYRQSLTDATDSLKGNVSQAGFQDLAKQVQKATDSFVKKIKSLGKPDTDAGKQAKATLDTLGIQLNSNLDTVKAVDGTSLVQGLSTVTSALATTQTQMKSAFDQLQDLDAQGELSDAFKQASACDSLR